MKEKLTRNIGLKVLAIILAILLWVVIANMEDPLVSKTFRNVSVDVLNEGIITSLEQVYEIKEGETITFTVEAKRSVIEVLSKDNFKVTADMKNLSIVDAVQIDITCPNYTDDVEVIDGKFQTMVISREELLEDKFKVNIVTQGEVADGYYIGETSASPNIITVSGPKARVDRIKEVIVEVDVTGITNSIKKNAVPQVIDHEGYPIDSTKLSFSSKEIEVSIGLLETKTISLMITTTGEPESGYEQTNLVYEPTTIIVAGDPQELKKLSYVSIQENISGAKENIEKDIDLQEYLPEGIILVGADKTASVNITIEKLVKKEVTILLKDIEVKNKPKDTTINYNSYNSIVIELVGRSEIIKSINRSSINASIDLADLAIGTYSIPVILDLSEDVEIKTKPIVNLTIR